MASSSSQALGTPLEGITDRIYIAAKNKELAALNAELKKSFEQNSIQKDLFAIFLKLRKENDKVTKEVLLQQVAEVAFGLGVEEGFKFFGSIKEGMAVLLANNTFMEEKAASQNFSWCFNEYHLIINNWARLIAKNKPEQFIDFLNTLLKYFSSAPKSFPFQAFHSAFYLLGTEGQMGIIEQVIDVINQHPNCFNNVWLNPLMGHIARGLADAGHVEKANEFVKITQSYEVLSQLTLGYVKERPQEALKILELILKTQDDFHQKKILLKFFSRLDESLCSDFIEKLKPLVRTNTFSHQPAYDLETIVKKALSMKEYMSRTGCDFQTAELVFRQGSTREYAKLEEKKIGLFEGTRAPEDRTTCLAPIYKQGVPSGRFARRH